MESGRSPGAKLEPALAPLISAIRLRNQSICAVIRLRRQPIARR